MGRPGGEKPWRKVRQSNERAMQGAFGGGHHAASFTQGTRVLRTGYQDTIWRRAPCRKFCTGYNTGYQGQGTSWVLGYYFTFAEHRVLGYWVQGTRVLSHICRAHSFYRECSEGGSICEAHLRFVIPFSLRTANPLPLEQLLTPSSCIQAACTGDYEGVRLTQLLLVPGSPWTLSNVHWTIIVPVKKLSWLVRLPKSGTLKSYLLSPILQSFTK